jgi:hypothetical protein
MSKIKVLFFLAAPLSAPRQGRAPRLLLDEEIREIRESVRAAAYRDDLEFDVRWAVRTDDLLQALIETRPQVVHFRGHGWNEGLALEGADGSAPHFVDAAALAQLFQMFRNDIRLVVLNGCFSLPQATMIAEAVGCVVGTRGDISDAAASTFGTSFYRAIGFGDSVQAAYEQSCIALALGHPDETKGPEMVGRTDVDSARLFLSAPASGHANERKTVGLAQGEDAGPRGQSLPSGAPAPSGRWRTGRVGITNIARSTVFISYSHKDRKWLERLQVHLKPIEREGLITRWDDTLIKPGTQWRGEIERALDSARVAILLISADFLASDYIRNNELPPLLEAAGAAGATIFPVILSSCRFAREPSLAKFQAVNDPARPLDSQTRARQEGVFDRLSEAIEQVLLT